MIAAMGGFALNVIVAAVCWQWSCILRQEMRPGSNKWALSCTVLAIAAGANVACAVLSLAQILGAEIP